MEIPGLGTVTKDARFGWYVSEPLPVAVLGGQLCRITVEDYDADPNKEEFHTAIANFLSIDKDVLKAAEPSVFRYYQHCNDNWEPDDEEFIAIASPSVVWAHVQLGSSPTVKRRGYGDNGIYISLECNCDWEPEHGLQIVFKNGLKVNKIGPYDGHCTNSDAYGVGTPEDVIYR